MSRQGPATKPEPRRRTFAGVARTVVVEAMILEYNFEMKLVRKKLQRDSVMDDTYVFKFQLCTVLSGDGRAGMFGGAYAKRTAGSIGGATPKKSFAKN